MGQWLTKDKDCMPPLYSFNNYEHTVQETNTIAKRLCKDLHFLLNIQKDSLNFNFNNWKKSIVAGTIGLQPSRQRRLMEEKEREDEYECEQELNITMQMSQIYELYDLLKHFKKQQTTQGNTPLESTPTAGEDKTCQICYDQEPDLALPCGVQYTLLQHRFGPKCVSAYIIEKDERICPMCRKQFLCSRSSIERNIYTVIDKENNETVYKEIRAGLMNILKRNNAKEVNILDTYLHEKYGSK